MGSKSAPPAPDYAAAAGQQAQASRQITAEQTAANRPNTYTPWGSQTWTQGQGGTRTVAGTATNGAQFDAQRYLAENQDVAAAGMDAFDHYQRHGRNEGRQAFYQDVTENTPGEWTQRIELSPQQQQALDSQMAVQLGRSNAAQQLLGQATNAFQTPMNWDSLPDRAGSVSAPGQGQFQMQGATPFGFGGPIRQTLDSGGPIQDSFDSGGQIQRGFDSGGQIQRSLDATPSQYRDRAQAAIEQLMAPQLAQRRAAAETQLVNQGLGRGSEAWRNELRDVNDAETRAGLMAIAAGRDEAGQLFDQSVRSGDFVNRAQSQGFGQNMAAAGFANQAQGQAFGQNQAQAGFRNQAQAQRFGQGATAGAFQNAAQAQAFGQGQSAVDQANRIQAQDFGQQMSRFNADLQAGSFNNANRQSALAEMLQRRSQPLNELNALLTGQQVGMPEQPSFTAAGRAETPNIFGAAQAQGQNMLDQYNTQMGFYGNLAQAATAPFSFSDARLKEDIRYTGGSIGGVPVVHYRYRGLPTVYEGVIAQDALRIKPQAVALHSSGYLMVDYSQLG